MTLIRTDLLAGLASLLFELEDTDLWLALEDADVEGLTDFVVFEFDGESDIADVLEQLFPDGKLNWEGLFQVARELEDQFDFDDLTGLFREFAPTLNIKGDLPAEEDVMGIDKSEAE